MLVPVLCWCLCAVCWFVWIRGKTIKRRRFCSTVFSTPYSAFTLYVCTLFSCHRVCVSNDNESMERIRRLQRIQRHSGDDDDAGDYHDVAIVRGGRKNHDTTWYFSSIPKSERHSRPNRCSKRTQFCLAVTILPNKKIIVFYSLQSKASGKYTLQKFVKPKIKLVIFSRICYNLRCLFVPNFIPISLKYLYKN